VGTRHEWRGYWRDADGLLRVREADGSLMVKKSNFPRQGNDSCNYHPTKIRRFQYNASKHHDECTIGPTRWPIRPPTSTNKTRVFLKHCTFCCFKPHYQINRKRSFRIIRRQKKFIGQKAKYLQHMGSSGVLIVDSPSNMQVLTAQVAAKALGPSHIDHMGPSRDK